jgi:hypothetical protein
MHCTCCDKELTDFEATRKHSETGEYLDMCNGCFRASGLANIIAVEERHDLQTEIEIEEEPIYEFNNDDNMEN